MCQGKWSSLPSTGGCPLSRSCEERLLQQEDQQQLCGQMLPVRSEEPTSQSRHRTVGSRREEKGKGAHGGDRHSAQRGGSPGIRGGLSRLSHSSLSEHG